MESNVVQGFAKLRQLSGSHLFVLAICCLGIAVFAAVVVVTEAAQRGAGFIAAVAPVAGGVVASITGREQGCVLEPSLNPQVQGERSSQQWILGPVLVGAQESASCWAQERRHDNSEDVLMSQRSKQHLLPVCWVPREVPKGPVLQHPECHGLGHGSRLQPSWLPWFCLEPEP